MLIGDNRLEMGAVREHLEGWSPYVVELYVQSLSSNMKFMF